MEELILALSKYFDVSVDRNGHVIATPIPFDEEVDAICREVNGYDYWPDFDDPEFSLENIIREVKSWKVAAL